MSAAPGTQSVSVPPRSNAAASSSSTAGIPPNQTLYVTNLNDKVNKQDLRMALYTIFSTYGTVLDVVALKTMKMRGQAHIVFRDVNCAGAAMRALQGFNFLGKEMKISYAKSKSDIMARLDGTYKIPNAGKSAQQHQQAGTPFAALPGQGLASSTTATTTTTTTVTTTTTTTSQHLTSTSIETATHGIKRPREEDSDEEAEMETED